MPLVSIIIVTWNGRELLEKCLPSVVATEYPNVEIILADNASSDGSAEWVKENYPQVTVVRHPANWAFCRGNNEALPHANGKYVVLLNNDVEVSPGWLGPLVDVLEANPRVGAVQPKILQFENRSLFEYAGGSGGFMDDYGYPFTRGRVFFTMEADMGQYDDAREIFWATGAAIMLRRDALEEAGGLEEYFYMHMEEIDLCWRLQRQGYSVRIEPKSQVYHLGGSTLPQGSPQKIYYNFRNSLLMLYKNLSPRDWWRRFPVRVGLDIVAAGRALMMGRTEEALAIARAYKDAHSRCHVYNDQRPGPGDPVVLPPYRGSIVLDYFLRGRLNFQDLPSERFRKQFRPKRNTADDDAHPVGSTNGTGAIRSSAA